MEEFGSWLARYGGTFGGGGILVFALMRWLSKQKISIHIGGNGNGNGKSEALKGAKALTGEELAAHCLRMHEPLWGEIKQNHDTQLRELRDIGEAVARIDERTRKL